MQYLVIGHSWVRRLAGYRSLLPNGATFLGVGVQRLSQQCPC